MREELSLAVVDDDEAARRAVVRLLRVAGFRVSAYSSAEELLADPEGSGFDCLVLDVWLGGISGVELAEQMAQSGSTAAVVFLTANDQPETRERASRLPRTTYLSKTEPAEALFAAIRGSVASTVNPSV